MKMKESTYNAVNEKKKKKSPLLKTPSHPIYTRFKTLPVYTFFFFFLLSVETFGFHKKAFKASTIFRC